MIDYVAGFLHNDTSVALVKKNRPEWQYGLMNGVGGKIEKFDTLPADAMEREFEEEAGVKIPANMWDHFLTLRGTESLIYCFAVYDTGNWLDNVVTMEDEEIVVSEFELLARLPRHVVPNINWILPLMRQRGNFKPVEVVFYSGTRGTK